MLLRSVPINTSVRNDHPTAKRKLYNASRLAVEREEEYIMHLNTLIVVEGKQIYLPFMAVYLQERGDGEKQDIATMLPSAQLLLLFYIYRGCGELLTSEASQKLGFTATSISRASRQLEEMGLIKTEKRGVQKVIYSDQTPEEVFSAARESMCNPVKRTIYVPKTNIETALLLSGYSALSEYSMINPPMVECFAAWEKEASNKLQSSDDQCAVELWRYDPRKLSGGNCVDKLSLALALSADKDERIEKAVEEMLTSVWEGFDYSGPPAHVGRNLAQLGRASAHLIRSAFQPTLTAD